MLRLTSFELLTLPRLGALASDFVKGDGEMKREVDGREGNVKTLAELDEEGRTGIFGEFYKRKQDRFLVLAPRVQDVLRTYAPEERERWDTCTGVFLVSTSFLETDSSLMRSDTG